MTKKILISLPILALVFVLGISLNIIKLPVEREIHLQYVADFSDNKVLMGASHNVFVGKVLKQTGNLDTGIGPETQYSVEVIYNIKGDLTGAVTVNQQGGYKNGVLYLVHNGDVLVEGTENADALLKTGSTYLFTSRYDDKHGWHMLISHPNGRKLISQDSSLSTSQLLELAKSDQKVLALQEAYKYEVLLEADVLNNNTRNSYNSLQE